MVRKNVGQRPCLARIKVHPDYLRGYQEVLAYWKQQGISPRYLNPDKSMAFNCGQIGEDLLHTDPVRKEEAYFAMKGFYPYPLATQIKRHWHFRDDAQPYYEKAWDPVEQAAEIIGQVLKTLRSGQSKFDPSQGDLCRYLFWPRLDWQRSALARSRFNRKEADRQLAEWRAHPDCGDLNCAECAARYISLEPFTEEAYAEGGEEIVPTYARTSQLQNIRLPWDDTAFPDFDPVAEEILGQEESWGQLAEVKFLSQKDTQLLDLLYIHDMTPEEIANQSGKLLKTIQNRSYGILSRMETQISKCILSRVLELICYGQDIHFADHHPDIERLIYETLRRNSPQEDILSPVTRSIFLATRTLFSGPMGLTLAKYEPAPFVFLSCDEPSERSKGSSEVYRRFQRAVLSEGSNWGHNRMMVIGGAAKWFWNQMIQTTSQKEFYRTLIGDDCYFCGYKTCVEMWKGGVFERDSRDDIRKGLSEGMHILSMTGDPFMPTPGV
jgi:hypothetical protein